MDLFRIDADEVAQRIGLDEPVPIIWSNPPGPAAFDVRGHRVVLSRTESWYALRTYDLNYYGRVARPLTNDRDAVRFAVAHEMGHALQLQRMGPDRLQAWLKPQYLEERMLGIAHHKLPAEAEADALGRAHWHHVKIDGHKARGAR